MRLKKILSLDGLEISYSTMHRIQKSKCFICCIYCGDNVWDITLEGGWRITVYLKEENKNDKTANT